MADDNDNKDLDKDVAGEGLTAKDPGHKDYDPLKDQRVRRQTDTLHSQIATTTQEKDELAKQIGDLQKSIDAFKAKDKEKDDKDKSELVLSNEKVTELEKLKLAAEKALEKSEVKSGNEINTLNAKLLAHTAIINANAKVNKLELRGLIGEVTDKLKTLKAEDSREDAVKAIVTEFITDRGGDIGAGDDDKDKKKKTPPPIKPGDAKKMQDDLQKKLNELMKDPEKNEKEIEDILRGLEKPQE